MGPYPATPVFDDLPGGSYRTEEIGWIVEHLSWMRRCGRADSTLRTRRATLTRLAEHLRHDPATATLAELEVWQETLSSLSSIRHQTQLIRPYYAWLVARGHRNDDPALLLPMPRKRIGLPRPIPEDDLMRAITDAPKRELPWLLLAGWCGMRAAEIAGMRREAIHCDVTGARWARITGKGDVERDVGIPDWVWARIEPLMWPSGWCWRRTRGWGTGEQPVTAQHVSQYCNEYLHRVVGITDTLHSLRHRVATQALAETGDIRLVQATLGHRHLSTTQVYAAVRQTSVASALERLPRPAGNGVRPPRQPDAPGSGSVTSLSADEIQHYIAAWLASRRSQATRDGYGRDLETWCDWCSRNNVPVLGARFSDADLYRVWLETQKRQRRGGQKPGPYSPATVGRRLAAVKSFYEYAFAERLIDRNPFQQVKLPSPARYSSTPGLSKDEAMAFLQAAEDMDSMARAMAWVLLTTGLRVSELCNLDLGDITGTPGDWKLAVVRKGGQDGIVTVASQAAVALEAWIAERPTTPSQAVFLNQGVRLHRRRAFDIVRAIARRAGVTIVSPHGLRHTAATLALDAGVGVEDVQQMLGHRDVEATLYYDRKRRMRGAIASRTLATILARPNPSGLRAV